MKGGIQRLTEHQRRLVPSEGVRGIVVVALTTSPVSFAEDYQTDMESKDSPLPPHSSSCWSFSMTGTFSKRVLFLTMTGFVF